VLHIAKNIFPKGLSKFNLLYGDRERKKAGRKEEKK